MKGGELDSHEELDYHYHLRVRVRSRGRRRCWTLKLAQEISRAGRWSWALTVGIAFASAVPQQLCYGHCLCDCSAQQLKQQLAESTQAASHWPGPYCLYIVVVPVVVK